MKHNSITAAFILLVLTTVCWSCGRKAETAVLAGQVKILPLLTKVTDESFENGDAIGVNIKLSTGPYATNARMVYDGSCFASSLEWYDGTASSTITAWYPYSGSVPTSFKVQTDQSAGLSTSDFVAGSASGVRPSETPVKMHFTHRMSRLKIKVDNQSGKVFGDLRVGGVVAEAVLSNDMVASAVSSASRVEITPCLIGGNYYLIIPPQTASLTLSFTMGGELRSLGIPSSQFVAGAQYAIELSEISAKLVGEIVGWGEGRSYTVTLPQKTSPTPVGIDGDFSDWDNITAETADGEYIIYEENTNPDLTGMLRLKLTSDTDFIYVYTELSYDNVFVAEGGPYSQGDCWNGFQPIHPGTPGALIIYVGADDDDTGAFAARSIGEEESMWDYTGFDAFPSYWFLWDVAANRMQFGWNMNKWPQNHCYDPDAMEEWWGKPLGSHGDGWWGNDVEGTPVADNTVSDERTFKFSGIEKITDPVSNAEVSVIKIEFAMDRSAINEDGTKVNGKAVIGAFYEQVGETPAETSAQGSGKLPSGNKAVTLMLLD